MIDHYAEINACPDDVYGSSIRQDASTADTLEFGPYIVDPKREHAALSVS